MRQSNRNRSPPGEHCSPGRSFFCAEAQTCASVLQRILRRDARCALCGTKIFAPQRISARAVSPTITGKQIPNLRLWRNGYVQKGLYRHQRFHKTGTAGHHRPVARHQARHPPGLLSPADEKYEPRHDLSAVEHPHARVVRDGHEPARRPRDHRRHGQGALAPGRRGHGPRHRAQDHRGARRCVHHPGHQRHERL